MPFDLAKTQLSAHLRSPRTAKYTLRKYFKLHRSDLWYPTLGIPLQGVDMGPYQNLSLNLQEGDT